MAEHAEYIKREALLNALKEERKKGNFVFTSKWIKEMMDDLPGADVAPKSEVEELICKLECFLCHVTGGRLSKHTYDLKTMETVATDCINETYNDGYGAGYKDCAREIFEEIEKLHLHVTNEFDVRRYAELKKKHLKGDGAGL